jgi:DNA-binding MarR family transcriptional regulator
VLTIEGVLQCAADDSPQRHDYAWRGLANRRGAADRCLKMKGSVSERHPMRASELARHLGVRASTMSAATKRLTSLGYIAREPDKGDRRAASLRLSKAGAHAMQADR